MSGQEYRVERCGGLTVYQPVGKQYPDLLQPKQAEVIEYKSRWKLSMERNLWEKQEAA